MTNTNNTSADAAAKSLKGYRIMIGLLVVVLVAVSALYFSIHSQQSADYNLLSTERDEVKAELTELVANFDNLETSNEELKLNMEIERNRADSIITQLTKERRFNYTKLKQYEREVGTLRSLMRGYLQQIDSLNNLNQKLISENVSYKKQISTVELRASEAEERARELDTKIKEGSRLRAEGITITAINQRGRTISRAKRAASLSVNFTLVPNELAAPGNKEIYARITSPDGYVLTTDATPTFKFNGENLTYSASRSIDYQNASLPVSIFYAGDGFEDGVYEVELYYANYSIGKAEVNVK